MLMEYYLNRYADVFSRTDRNMWNYEDGCVLIGLNALYEATGDEKYLQWVRTFMDRYIGEDGSIRLYRMEDYNVDFIPTGRVLFPLYEKTGRDAYRRAAEQLMEQLRHQPRTAEGSFWHKKIYPHQVWLDGLYMALPFYAMYQLKFGDGNLDDIILQFDNVRKRLFDEEERLHYHAYCHTRDIFWCKPETGRSANFWSRAIGWHLMAFADIYALMPTGEQRAHLRDLWQETMDGVVARLDPKTHMLYQLTAKPELAGNYPETSSSLMVAYSLMKGARLGAWADNQAYGKRGMEVLMAIEAQQFRVGDDGLHLGGMCKGAGLGPDGNFYRDGSCAYYLSEDVVEDEQKGVGVCMMAYAEYLRLAAADPSQGPAVNIFTKKYDAIMPDEIPEWKKNKGTGKKE